MELFFQNGVSFTTPPAVWSTLWPLVQRFLWGGMRNTVRPYTPSYFNVQ